MKRPWYRFLYVRSPLAKIGLSLLSLLLAFAVLMFLGLRETNRMEAQTLNWDGRSIQNGAAIYANNCSSCHGVDGKGGAAPALHSRYFFEGRLTDLQFTGSLHDYVKLTVAAGRPNNKNSQWAVMMPTWSSRYGGPLRDDQVEDVTNFVLNWETDAKEQTAETDPWIPFQNAPMTDIYTGQTVEVVTPEPSSGPRTPQQLFTAMGCVGCHKLDQPQTAQNIGAPGPNLGNLYELAGSMVPGQDAAAYVHTSIVDPNAHVVEGYMAGIMPQDFSTKMTEDEINSLVQWILDPNRPQ